MNTNNPREPSPASPYSRSMGSTAAAEKEGMVDTIKEKAKDVAQAAKGKAQEWGSAVADAAGQAKDKAQEWASTAADKAQDFGQDVTRLIRQYPIQSLFVGLGLGFLLARLSRRD
jgi:ElaB/YqjD/DUF883 family membrane-anchored ribosome-binding protein